MKVFSVVIISLLSVFALVLLYLFIKSHRPFKSAATNAFLGLVAIAAVNLTFRFTGVRIPLNIYTLPGSAIFGIPFVCALTIVQVLI